MNNNGMIVYKEGFISKIKKFFKKLFGNKKQEENNIQTITNEKEQESNVNEREDKFLKEIKVDIDASNDVIKKNAFLEELDGNVEALNMLSVDRLKKLEKYYDDIIKQNDAKIKKLKTT